MKWLRLGLEIIGACALILLLVGALWVMHDSNSEKKNTAKQKDVLFVLNAGGISTNQNLQVIASYQSERSFTGDHLDCYCIQLEKFEVMDQAKGDWNDGPERNPLLAEALELGINAARGHADCFPSPQEANSQGMKIMFWSVVLHGRHPTAAEIIMVDPKVKRLYYVSFKT